MAGATVTLLSDVAASTPPGGTSERRVRRRFLYKSKDGPEQLSDMRSIVKWTARTNSDGRYTIGGLKAGSYRVLATHLLFAPSVERQVALVTGAAENGVDLNLRPGGAIAVRTFDADGKPLPGARVRLSPEAGGSGPAGEAASAVGGSGAALSSS